jgi:hypothetical protein
MHNVFAVFSGFTLPLIIPVPYSSVVLGVDNGPVVGSSFFLHRPSPHHDNKISGCYAILHLAGLSRLVYKVRDDPRASKHLRNVDSAP